MALEEHLLSFELSEGDARSGGACCKVQALSHGAAPASHCGSVDVSGHRQHCSGHLPSGVWRCGGLTAPPPGRPASAAACAGRRSTANRCHVEPPAATRRRPGLWWRDSWLSPDRQLSAVVVFPPRYQATRHTSLSRLLKVFTADWWLVGLR